MTEHEATPHVGMIWAEARGGALGRAGSMPWYLPEDLDHFKRTTMAAPVIMGRRTWQSLPERVRPLPGRTNIVVTRDAHFSAEGAGIARSLEAAVELVKDEKLVWIMGGGEIYRTAMPIANELVVTRIDLEVPDADTFAPEIGASWRRVDAGTSITSQTGLGYRIERWLRG